MSEILLAQPLIKFLFTKVIFIYRRELWFYPLIKKQLRHERVHCIVIFLL